MLRSHVGTTLLRIIIRHSDGDVINRAELRQYILQRHPGTSTGTHGNCSTRYLNAALRELERAGVVRRRDSGSGSYLDVLAVEQARRMLLLQARRFTDDKPALRKGKGTK